MASLLIYDSVAIELDTSKYLHSYIIYKFWSMVEVKACMIRLKWAYNSRMHQVRVTTKVETLICHKRFLLQTLTQGTQLMWCQIEE